jgi:BlaI family transcriptional regulator, penicillinase repressor
MEVLWSRGSATVSEALSALPASDRAAFNTVQTILRILEDKGYVKHRVEGRAFRYVPLVDREQARSSAVKHVLQRFFNGAPAQLAINLIERESLSEDDLHHLADLIERARTNRE